MPQTLETPAPHGQACTLVVPNGGAATPVERVSARAPSPGVRASVAGGCVQGSQDEAAIRASLQQGGKLHDGKIANTRVQLRKRLQQSKWYHTRTATSLRTFLHGKVFALVMIVALIAALFMPDVWILAGVNSNLVSDVVLTIVMVLFTAELVLLSAVDAAYCFSFFQLMDVFGTVSMIFDISYMVGTDATYSPVASNDSNAEASLMLLRASRAAKIGARAGRLSRVLRILRFLPFLTGGVREQSTGIASSISGQLANLLAVRVACLTIILVMVIPLFDIWTFPQSDHSLQTWTHRISRNFADGRPEDGNAELVLMAQFYGSYDYFPWEACLGNPTKVDGRGSFECSNDTGVVNWSTDRRGPPRHSSSTRVHSETFMVAFNMHWTVQLKSALNMVCIVFILMIMVFSGLTLSSVVTELAVRPLERMLNTVRQIASTVFKLSAETAGSDVDDEAVDLEESSEMKLLEKVVQKLATVAELQSSRQIQATDDMRDEDLGVLSMMNGKNVLDEQKAVQQARKSCAIPRKKASVAVRLEDFGVSPSVFQSWGFNVIPLTRPQRISLEIITISQFHDSGESYVGTQAELQVLQRFIQAVEKEYQPVPFHNFAHALDVTHAVARMMIIISSEAFLTELEQYVLLIAAAAHDLGHPGVNNGFLSEVGHDLALQYNDRSPLENMHCAKLYTIVAAPATNVFNKLSKEEYREARKNIIETILHTDMMSHGAMVKDLQMTYQMNQEMFSNRCSDSTQGVGVAEAEVFSQAGTKKLVMECLLHSADVSNPCRSWEVTYAWAVVCLEEFFAQGDQEKMLGVPVQFLNDRDKLNKPNSQIGFIEFMIAPFFAAQIKLWPSMRELGDNLGNNLANWADQWEREVNPSADDKAAVLQRVHKVKDSMQEGEK